MIVRLATPISANGGCPIDVQLQQFLDHLGMFLVQRLFLRHILGQVAEKHRGVVFLANQLPVALADSPAVAQFTDSTTSVSMQEGVAVFDNLKLDQIGPGYRFRFRCSGGYRPVEVHSPFFTVTNPISELDGASGSSRSPTSPRSRLVDRWCLSLNSAYTTTRAML